MTNPVEAWCATLGGLLNPAMPGEAMKALRTLLPHLRLMPMDAFTGESARRVASAERYGPVPDWGIIERVLRGYLRDIRPINHHAALPAPREPEYQRAGPEEVARIMASLAEHNAERKASIIDNEKTGPTPSYLTGEALRQARVSTGVYPRIPAEMASTP